MTLVPGLRKLLLTTHITFSVGWLGAVAVFFALALAGLSSTDEQVVRSAYLAMDLSARYVIVPACLVAFLSGVVQSFGTPWGLFKHYWIVVKLILTVASTVLLLLHMQPIGMLANAAAAGPLSAADLRDMRIQLAWNAGAALFVLLLTTALSVYKPWGKLASQPSARRTASNPLWGRYMLIGLIALAIIAALMHLFGGGLGHH